MKVGKWPKWSNYVQEWKVDVRAYKSHIGTYIIDGGNTQVLLLGLVKLRFEKCGLRNKSGVILMKVSRHNETDQMLGGILDLEGNRCQCIDGKLASLGHALVGIVGGKVLVTVLRELLEVDAAL